MNSEAKTKKHNKKKVIIAIVVVIIILIIAALLWGGNYLVTFGLQRDFDIPNIQPDTTLTEDEIDDVYKSYEELDEMANEWLADADRQKVSVLSDDGLALSGELIPADEESDKWVIVVHGYRGNHLDVTHIAVHYAKDNFNVLLPDLRGCGESGGEYLGMGWPDRFDMLKWIDLIIERDADAQIILHGVSMGGATVMMASGEKLQNNVRAVVEDCGYTSVWDIFSDEIGYVFDLPPFPLLNIASGFSKLRAGYNFTEASSLVQVAKSETPTLFIHGSQDSFVHTDMVYELYDACTAEKELLVVEGADHGLSGYVDTELYVDATLDFINRYLD